MSCLREVCGFLTNGQTESAADVLRRDYPFAPDPIVSRTYGPLELTRLFVRDGFVDRYTGDLLVFPPVLRVLSTVLPAEFPFHPHWKTDVTHRAYWEISATLDHVIPVSRGGRDDESNWVTTSMARNNAKLNWTVDELGWTLHPLGDFQQWDGLMRWFLEYTTAHKHLVAKVGLRAWQTAAATVVGVDAART